ncbi:hypothetical protein R1sor_024667 [Riccia sorocarpa]|uniref:Uncharacterized protein n=1 Tax=Riccia sorocarpa TaxID=122646 RepID=A0ABD3GSQ7_9MARC
MCIKDLEAKLQQCKAELCEVRAHQQRLENDLTEAEKKISTSAEKNVELEANVYYLSLIKQQHTKLRAENKLWEVLQAELQKQLEDKDVEITCLNEKYNQRKEPLSPRASELSRAATGAMESRVKKGVIPPFTFTSSLFRSYKDHIVVKIYTIWSASR